MLTHSMLNLLLVAMTKALLLNSQEITRILFLNTVNTQSVPMQASTVYVNSHREMAQQEDKYFSEENELTRERRENYNLRTASTIEDEKFNVTMAVEKGLSFQAEFCSWKCHEDSDIDSRGTSGDCPHKRLLCVPCPCGNNCSESTDCCELRASAAFQNGSDIPHTTDNNASLGYSCFSFDENISILIISSCAKMTNLKILPEWGLEEELHTFIHNPFSERILAHCSSCLSVPESVSLITSYTSGATYCNHYCLTCHEGRSVYESDFKWQKRSTCETENSITRTSSDFLDTISTIDAQSTIRNGTTEAQTRSTDCRTLFDKPNSVNVLNCNKEAWSGIIDNCSPHLVENLQNLSSDTLHKLKELCHLYNYPVYDDDQVYRNIFCYLCQGKVPLCFPPKGHDHPDIPDDYEVNLGFLTDLSRDGYNGFQEEPGSKELTPSNSNTNKDEQDTLKCPQGFWQYKAKERCLQIQCAPGRTLTGNTSFEASCQLEDEKTASNFYKLNLVWYFSMVDVFHNVGSYPQNSQINIFRDIKTNIHNNKDNQNLKNAHLAYKDSFIFSVDPDYRSSCGRSNDVSREEVADHNKDTFITSNHRYMSTSVIQDIPELLHSIFEVKTKTKSIYRYNDDAVPMEASSSDSEDVNDLFIKEITQNMSQFIPATLQSVGIKDFFFQIYHLTSNTSIFKREENVDEVYNRKDVSLSALPQAVSGVGAVVYLRFNEVGSRYIFENEILRHFVGMKNITVYNNVFTVEMGLSSPDKVMNSVIPVYFSYPENGECCAHVELQQHLQLFRQISCFDTDHRPIMFSSVTSCPFVTLNISELNILNNSSNLSKSVLDISLLRNQFLWHEHKVHVCLTTLDPSSHEHTMKSIEQVPLLIRIESILTWVSLLLSLTCLFLTFITYSLFPLLRSLPGKNNMILVCWLFSAQLLVLLSPKASKHSTACTIMGVLLHYSWLCTFCWTCVCSFHMFHVFVIRRGAPHSDKSHAFYLTRYVLISNTVTAAIVSLVILVSMNLSGGLTAGYGGRICYLNSNVLVGVAFVLPLSLVLMLNVVFFFLTVYTISRIDEVKRHSGSERRNVHVYFRLSSLTGLSWFLALLAEIPGLKPFRCVSVLVVGCQGLTLFLSYVCNRRVARMWRLLLKRKGTGFTRRSVVFNRQATFSSSL